MQVELKQLFLDAFERNRNRIYRICCSYAKDHDDAKDLFQDVLLNVWKSLPTYKKTASIDTWIYRITINVCLRSKDKMLKKKSLFKPIKGIECDNFHAQVNTNENEDFALLFKCIQALDTIDRSIVLLYLESIAYREIAEITGLTENHVAVKMKRIKNKLSNCIKKRKDG